MCVLIVDLVC